MFLVGGMYPFSTPLAFNINDSGSYCSMGYCKAHATDLTPCRQPEPRAHISTCKLYISTLCSLPEWVIYTLIEFSCCSWSPSAFSYWTLQFPAGRNVLPRYNLNLALPAPLSPFLCVGLYPKPYQTLNLSHRLTDGQHEATCSWSAHSRTCLTCI
jgi:hypothetical protein